MGQDTTKAALSTSVTTRDTLTEVLRLGARKLLAVAVEEEVAAHIEQHAHLLDSDGRRRVVRNGHLPEREILTGLGPITVRQPRVNDTRVDEHGQRIRFTSAIVPKYLRKAKSIEELIPWLYLKGVSTGDFSEALASLVGPEAPGLSASTVTRLKSVWEDEHTAWSQRDLSDKRYVYIWVDGIHFNIRLEEDRQCILVVIGATEDGTKELIAVHDGYRESEQSWREVLLDLKARGLTHSPELATGDGALGFWKALPQVWPKTRWQRCWVHKTANVLNKLPKSKQVYAKQLLHAIWMASTKKEAKKAFRHFLATFGAKYPKAAKCLEKDEEVLLTFYDFPAEHWVHIRTTNPIESTFATVRLRTVRTKGCGTRAACLAMVFKLAQCAQKRWRRLNRSELLGDVIRGVIFTDGIRDRAA